MQNAALTPEEYISKQPPERQKGLNMLRNTILSALPEGFTETINYGMIGYVVPKSIYPKGYHSNPKLPLPFMSIASQKNHIALYHSGVYANRELYGWFINAYENQMGRKPDMGKSCIRFIKPDHIPFSLIAELVSKITPKEWIAMYEAALDQRNG